MKRTNHKSHASRVAGLRAEDREFVEKRIKEAEAADPGKGCAMVVKEMLRSVRASVITFFKDGMHKFTLKNSFTYTQSCEVSYRDVLPISPPVFYALEADDVDMYKKAVREAADRMKHETDDWDWEDLHVEQVWLAMKTDVSNSFNPTVSICAPYAETVEGIPDKPRLSDIFNSWPDVRATTADEESAKDAASGQFNALTLGELASVMGSVNLLSWYFGHMTTHNYKGNEARFATMEKAERDKQPQRILLQPLRWFYSRMVALALTWATDHDTRVLKALFLMNGVSTPWELASNRRQEWKMFLRNQRMKYEPFFAEMLDTVVVACFGDGDHKDMFVRPDLVRLCKGQWSLATYKMQTFLATITDPTAFRTDDTFKQVEIGFMVLEILEGFARSKCGFEDNSKKLQQVCANTLTWILYGFVTMVDPCMTWNYKGQSGKATACCVALLWLAKHLTWTPTPNCLAFSWWQSNADRSHTIAMTRTSLVTSDVEEMTKQVVLLCGCEGTLHMRIQMVN